MPGPFKPYEPPPNEEGDTWNMRSAGERNGQIIVKVLKYREHVVTKNSDDAEEVRLDVVDLSDPTGQYVYRNVPVWSGAVVDGLKPYVGTGDVLVLDVSMKKSRGGRDYPVISPATDFSVAERFWASKGDPFAQQFSTVAGNAPAAGGFGSSRNDDPPF